MADTAPAHVSDVQQTVDSTKINKRTEIGNVLDGSLTELTHLERFEKTLLHLLAFFFDQTTTRNNNVSTRLVDLQNHTFDLRTNVFRNVVRTTNVHLAGGQEDVDANVQQQSTLDLADDATLDDVAFGMSADDLFPLATTVCFPLGKDDQSDGIFELFKLNFDLLADFRNIFVLLPLVPLDHTFTLVTDVDDNLVVVHPHNRAGQDFIQVVCLSLLVVNLFFRKLRERRGNHRIKFRLVNVKFSQQITIDHSTSSFAVSNSSVWSKLGSQTAAADKCCKTENCERHNHTRKSCDRPATAPHQHQSLPGHASSPTAICRGPGGSGQRCGQSRNRPRQHGLRFIVSKRSGTHFPWSLQTL